MSTFNNSAKGHGASGRREAQPKVTRAELDRVAGFLRAMGAKVAAVNVMPGQTKIVTTDGQGLTIDVDGDELDQELEKYRRTRGISSA